MTDTRTVTIVRLLDANKARLAFLLPFLGTLATAAASFAISGDFNATEIRTAAGGTILALFAALGAYVAKPGTARATMTDVPRRTSRPSADITNRPQ